MAADDLCDLADVKFRLGITDASKDTLIQGFISRVSLGIMGYTGRRFARNPSVGTTTFLFDVPASARNPSSDLTTFPFDLGAGSRTLWVPRGIAEMSQLEVAIQTNAPYTVVPTADWFLDPPDIARDFGWPATRITLSDWPTGGTWSFYPGKRVVRATMAEGWGARPGDIQGIAEDEVIRRYQGRGQGYTAAQSGEGFIRLLRSNAPDDAQRLEWYRARRA